MARTPIGGLMFADPSIRHGHVVLSEGRRYNEFTMSIETWRALQSCTGACAMLVDLLDVAPVGEYLIPAAVLDSHVAEEVARGLELVDPEPSQFCLYPPCVLPAVVVRDGFPLCEVHYGLTQTWDDLVQV